MIVDQIASWVASQDNPHETFSSFQEHLPVRLIATIRQNFRTCRPEEELSDVVKRNHEERFEFLPVLATDFRGEHSIVGVLDTVRLREPVEKNGPVQQYMMPLAERHLIGADASILGFIRTADHDPFRFVVSEHHISGLITLSDLQRLPVRAALFATVTYMEMTMAEVIRLRFPEPEAWMEVLSQRRAEKVREKVLRARAEDTLVDQLLYTEFCDKVTIIDEALLSLTTKQSFRNDLKEIQSLRDNLAHANNFAATRESAKALCACVRRMDHWITFLIGLKSSTG